MIFIRCFNYIFVVYITFLLYLCNQNKAFTITYDIRKADLLSTSKIDITQDNAG